MRRRRLWHPHQGLWNWDLVAALTRQPASARPPRNGLAWALIHADTTARWLIALWRRVRRVGPFALWARPQVPVTREVVHLDLGTHQAARELSCMAGQWLPRAAARWRVFGFEANPESLQAARQRVGEDSRVQFVHAAVCGQIPEGGYLRLYRHGDGHGDSLLRAGSDAIEVPALRLSEWLAAQDFAPDAILLLRMNIEGAEEAVLRDLHAGGWLGRVAGFFGMWDDLSKIDAARDRNFRAWLRHLGVRPFTFNERDFVSPWRVRAIGYDVDTCLLAALRAPVHG